MNTAVENMGAVPVATGINRDECLVDLRNIKKAFGGVHAVEDVNLTLYPSLQRVARTAMKGVLGGG